MGHHIKKGKAIMGQKSDLVKQNTTIEVESEKVYGVEMGHETGLINYNISKEGRWIFYSDRLSEDILPYELLDPKDKILDRVHLLENSTSGLDKITYDPHSWLSLVNAKKYLKAIELELVERYPKNKRRYEKNRFNSVQEITELEYEYKEKLEDLKLREFVVTHYAYAYLARDFDLRQFPLTSLASMETPSLKTIKSALDFCGIYDIDTIFYEENQDKKAAENLARELEGKALPLVSMEYINLDRNDWESRYVDFMRKNLENIYKSLR